jgi:GntR family transcriptional repressor for pyruvate dehydrogenase complex
MTDDLLTAAKRVCNKGCNSNADKARARKVDLRNLFLDKNRNVLYKTFVMSAVPLFRPLKCEKKIFEQISDQIRELIYSGTLKPGDKLPSEKELSSQFSTGRMVVREALRTLEESGLIIVKRGSLGGAFVKDPDATVMTRHIEAFVKIGNVTHRELTEVRIGIELAVLELAVNRRTEDDLALIKANVEKSERQFLKRERVIKDNLSFHTLLARSSKNPLYEMIVESIMNVAAPFMQLLKPEIHDVSTILESHKEIYAALRDKDLRKAKEKMVEHIIDISRKHMTIADKGRLDVYGPEIENLFNKKRALIR